MPSQEPQNTRRGQDTRTQVQDTDAIAASVELSIPQHVRQHASAPKLPGYVLAEPLGEGAYGQVWRSWQLRTRKEVAVKVFLQRTGLDWIFLQREVERLTRLDKHPHIVTLLDTNLDEEPPFYVMELVGRGSLQQWVTMESPADPRRAVRWMSEIADALSYVHAKGLIHCDLKPANILLDERECIRVVDFGQSRVFTESAASLGTLFYMAPEQAIPAQPGSPVQPDVRWDVYAFGATLYAILTGRVPYASVPNVQRLEQASTLAQRLADYRKMIERDPRPTWDGCPADPEVRAVIDKCMSPDAAGRYAAVSEVAADLRAMEKKRPIAPLAGSASYRAKKFIQRNPLQIGLVAAALAVAALLGWSTVKQRELDRGTASQILSLFVNDPDNAARQVLESKGRVRSYLGELTASNVSSNAFTERIIGSRAAFFVDPEAFWRSVDGGALWTHGEWLEVARTYVGDWSFPADGSAEPRLPANPVMVQITSTAERGTPKQRYVAFCLIRGLATQTPGLAEWSQRAVAGETDPGVLAASGSTPMLLGSQAPTPRFFADDLSGLIFAAIPPANDFRRGSPADEEHRLVDEEPPAQGAAIGAMHMSVTEVTLAALSNFWKDQWSPILANLPTEQREWFQKLFDGKFADLSPEQQATTAAGHVPLFMARMYCDWLNHRAESAVPKRRYRLPTEEEWEYACRAGNPGRYCFGDEAAYARYFAHCDGSLAAHHVVAQRMPNAFGLFDMHGGLWEFTESRYPPKFAQPEDAKKELFVRKGGAYYSPAVRCRSAQRAYSTANAVDFYSGFRLVMELQP